MSNAMDFTGGKGLEEFLPEVKGEVKQSPLEAFRADPNISDERKDAAEQEIQASTDFGIFIKDTIVQEQISLPAAAAALVANLTLIIKFLVHTGENQVAAALAQRIGYVLTEALKGD